MELKSSGVCRIISTEAKGSFWWVETVFRVSLPQRDRKDGRTESGVRQEEPVTLIFESDFPLSKPSILLRPDFPQDLPHLYDFDGPNGMRVPCIYEGKVEDLMNDAGRFHPVIMQIKAWLDRAATGLYDMHQGWEPALLPQGNGTLVIETSVLIDPVSTDHGSQIIPIEFTPEEKQPNYTRPDRTDKNGTPKYETLSGNGKKQETALLHVWPAAAHIKLCRRLWDLKTLEELFDRIDARGMGIRNYTMRRLKEIASSINSATGAQLKSPVPVLFVLTLRRPVNITDQAHALEPSPFLLEVPIRKPQDLEAKDVSIKLLNHRHPASSELLARLSGVPFKAGGDPTVFVGVGSLGSKLGTHLMKAGITPLRFLDDAELMPHVLARHDAGIPLEMSKARMMSFHAVAHGAEALSHKVNLLDVIKGKPDKSWTDLWINRARFLIDTTASDHVREAMINAGESLPGRLITCAFYANGNAGGLFIEGLKRTPRIDDLQASLHDVAIDGSLHEYLHGQNRGLARQYVGIGCHSMTMIMSNAQAALFAAGMGKKILEYHSDNPPDMGEWWFGHSDDTGLGSVWQHRLLGNTQVLNHAGNQKSWEVRVLSNVVDLMQSEARHYAPLENGGTLYGTINTLMRRIIVTRAEEVPPDSVRARGQFIHGTFGLRERVRKIERRSNGMIEFLGTWHSHPEGGGPSPIDHATARKFAQLRQTGPFVMLIALPDGTTRALVEENLRER